ncbi:GTPase [Photobacterium sp. MCCC 1A19761]|uniref:GTPase n=1 Tax=Photobacterium sp. MCCC 1A19761 TaxID=3115000 RepID=UPI00307D3947
MFEHFHAVRTVLDACRDQLTTYVGSEKVTALATEIEKRAEHCQPVVMVYGVYNAGKSTLLNALIGREEAEVGDIPKTDRVDAYQVGDVQILDTPGIDAPIEHEAVSREQLKKSDAVIFVLSSDGVLEEQQTYEEIGKILASGKPLLVVINNKSGYQDSDPDYVALKEKFRSNLYQHFAENEPLLARLNETPDFLVNADLALKGKLTGKAKLVEFSQIEALEKAVTRLFKETDSARIASTLAYQLSELLEEAIGKAQGQATQHELQQLEALITSIADARSTVFDKVKTRAEKAKPSFKTELVSLFEDGRVDAVEPVLAAWQNDLGDYFDYQLQRTAKKLDAEAAEVAKIFRNSPSYAESFRDDDNAQAENGSGFTELLKGLAIKGGRAGISDELMKEGIIYALKQGKSLAPEIFKGIGKKTMEKMAGKVVPFIGPAIDVLVAIYDYLKAREQEQKEMRQAQQRSERIRLHVATLVEELYDDFYERTSDTLEDTFEPMTLSLESSLRELSAQVGGVESDLRALKRALAQLKQPV